MSADEVHAVLIAEDDPATAATLKSYVESLGFVAIVATTFEELRAAVAAGGFCCALLDMEMPRAKGEAANIVHGYAGIDLVRSSDRRRTPTDRYVLQILIVTGYAKTSDFVSRVYDLGATGFIEKPFNAEAVLDKIRGVLKTAKREDHAACVALEASLTPAEDATVVEDTEPLVTLSIGTRRNAKEGLAITINGTKVALQDEPARLLLHLVAEFRRSPGEYIDGKVLGIEDKDYLPSRLAKAIAGALPRGFRLVEKNRLGGWRLNPRTKVSRVDWAGLTLDGHDGIVKIATAAKARGTR